MYVSLFLGFLGTRHFQALPTILREQNQAFSCIFRKNQALSGKIRLSGIFGGMILHDLPCFHMILYDPFGAQEPRNVSTDSKSVASICDLFGSFSSWSQAACLGAMYFTLATVHPGLYLPELLLLLSKDLVHTHLA